MAHEARGGQLVAQAQAAGESRPTPDATAWQRGNSGESRACQLQRPALQMLAVPRRASGAAFRDRRRSSDAGRCRSPSHPSRRGGRGRQVVWRLRTGSPECRDRPVRRRRRCPPSRRRRWRLPSLMPVSLDPGAPGQPELAQRRQRGAPVEYLEAIGANFFQQGAIDRRHDQAGTLRLAVCGGQQAIASS
jgi:hypothetical protein